ncbi:hypothetical protein [Histidinibacterium aquaticum]|uniref:Uncharacterized protein n=1 Tax=Histidinibacterium aquaticum TaxID=2613962 RepID=A0A5J5GD33_9RHOB|nr:hypothetical protein [Histidinibacterium aquaticum]KAA9005723.1 hypothetical protein F3S47_17645 [Histidinibacterium aquaticum]
MDEKIATCCYCGSRTALVLRGQSRHELSCANCGAPLHDMKRLRADATRSAKSPKPVRPAHPDQHWGSGQSHDAWRGRKSKKKKKKSFKRKALGELWDFVEDIFD